MEKEQNNKPVAWRVKGKGSPVIEVLESFNGDLYFITEKDPDTGDIFCYARLRSMPDMAEWGWSNINYLRESYGRYMIWNVKKNGLG